MNYKCSVWIHSLLRGVATLIGRWAQATAVPSGYFTFVPTLLLSIFTLFCLFSFCASWSPFILAVPMIKSLGRHLCMSYFLSACNTLSERTFFALLGSILF